MRLSEWAAMQDHTNLCAVRRDRDSGEREGFRPLPHLQRKGKVMNGNEWLALVLGIVGGVMAWVAMPEWRAK